ncbi:MAG: hypothetical protein ABSG01_15610 [Anaerolineales bacterium]|jgi:hypothetical protein
MKYRYWILGGFGMIVLIVVVLAVLILASGKFAGITAFARSGGTGGTGGGNNNIPNQTTRPAGATQDHSLTVFPTPTRLLTTNGIPGGPYLVKQTVSLGDITLQSPAGGVCTNDLFRVPATTPKVSFLLVFDPNGNYPGINGNTVGYTYNVPGAGETHTAQGSYTLAPNPDGTVTVTFDVKDHVTFNGFDGIMPIHYQFDLVPMGSNATCN